MTNDTNEPQAVMGKQELMDVIMPLISAAETAAALAAKLKLEGGT